MVAGHGAASPARVRFGELMALRAAGESFTLSAPRVRAASAGGHLSPFKGRGIEFDEARPYQPGDDLRAIDWRVTARTGKPHTKVFREERNRPVLVWLDFRRPMLFATRGAFKAVRAAQTAALLAWSALANGDRFGGLVFTESEHRELRPRLGRRAALRLFQLMSEASIWERPDASGSSTADGALLRLQRVARPGNLIFLLSDFRNPGEDFERRLRQLAVHGDLFLVHFYDPVEAELPPPGRYRIQLGTRTIAIDTNASRARASYREKFEARRARLGELSRSCGVRVLECATSDDPKSMLAGQFRTR